MLPPSLSEITTHHRRTLNARPDPPIQKYIQSNELLNVELVNTSQVRDSPYTAIPCGQASVETSAAGIAPSQACDWVLLQASTTNTALIYVGDSSAQYIELSAGTNIVLPVANLAQVIARSASGTQSLNYMYGRE